MLTDPDRTGFYDGTCPGMGEDLNENGARDQNATGDWNETDFLANDSDVDGVLDGLEVYGTWTYKDGTLGCSGGDKSACTLDPLNADTDGDQLRDGQELAGWTVGVWSEATMEKKETRNITSNPRLTDSDSDNLTDFQEFMNGSDPTRSDTDGDTISDWWEIQLKSNITGIDGTPPQISNVKLDIGIDWNWWGFLYLPLWSHVTVSFDVSDAVGLWNVQVTLFRLNGRIADPAPLVTWPWGVKATSYHFEKRWDISIVEAFAAGADVNISAEDVNGNMAWGQFHIKSIVEAAVAWLAAMLAGLAKFIVEAVSAIMNFVWSLLTGLMDAVFRPLFEAGAQVVRTLIDSLIGPLQASSKGRFMLPPFNNPGLGMQLALFLLTSPLMAILTAAFIVILAVEVIAKIFLPYLIAATEMLSEFISDNIWWILGLSAVVVAGGLTMGKPGEDPGGMIGFLGNMAGGDTAGWGWWLAAAMTEFGATLFTTFRFVDALFSPGLEALAGLVLLLVSPMFATGLMKLAIDVIGYLLDLHSAAELGQEKLEGAALVSERALVARAVADAISAFSPLISGFLLFTRNYKTETCCVLPWNPIIA